ncbi:DUF1737 domain-containing protein [Streptomyces sp. NPDC005706]|uniref:DUF1737 domain-containing protein n=1 Tax=Streptomyces sp. NPDC005706 TaxID=3157169 RepID=UPI0033DB39EE
MRPGHVGSPDRFAGESEILLLISTPPDGLPIYRVWTGSDDAAFCQRVSEAIGLGYELPAGPRGLQG